MIAACGVFGMMLPSASISMNDVWRVRVTSRRSLGSMFSTRERCLFPWFPFVLEPGAMAESATRRAGLRGCLLAFVERLLHLDLLLVLLDEEVVVCHQ